MNAIAPPKLAVAFVAGINGKGVGTDGNGCHSIQKPLILIVAATRFKINC
jgi:hypothetical protein